MAIKNIIASGIGFGVTNVNFIPTLGFGIAAEVFSGVTIDCEPSYIISTDKGEVSLYFNGESYYSK